MATNMTALDTADTQNTLRLFLARYPFLFYAALTLLHGWAPWYLTGEPGYLFFVPLLTALIMAPLVGGREGLMNFLRRMARVRAPWYTWLVALLLPGAIALAAIAIHVLLGGQAPDAALLNINADTLGQVAFIAVSFFLPLGSDNLGEFGFRGFGIPALQSKWDSLLGTLILGLFVTLWFLPQFFNPDSPQTSMGGMRFFPFFVLTEVGWSFMMTWVFNKSRGSSLIAGYIFHSAFNFWTVALLVTATVQGGELGFAPTFDTRLLSINAVLVGLTAVGFIVATRGELGSSQLVRLSVQEEFLFRGVLLPKMEGVFGKWSWVANGMLFAFYHVHQPWGMLGDAVGGVFFFTFPTWRFRSTWMGIIVHSAQSVFFAFLILGIVLGLA